MLAMPLIHLGGIHEFKTPHQVPGFVDWVMGNRTDIPELPKIIDTRQWMMPEAPVLDEASNDYRFVILLENKQWGLAVNELIGSETIESSQVRWRSQPGKRPWLAGMIKERMCALIHYQALSELFQTGTTVDGLSL